MARLFLVAVLLISCTPSQESVASPSPANAEPSQAPSTSAANGVSCTRQDGLPAVPSREVDARPTPSGVPFPKAGPPGTSLFLVDGTPAVYAGGGLTLVRSPYAIQDGTLRLSRDGARVVGLLTDATSRETFAWTHDLLGGSDHVQPLALAPLRTGVLWSPDTRRVASFPDPDLPENPAIVADLDGHVWRATLPGERIWWGLWRDAAVLTFVSFRGEALRARTQDVRVWNWSPGSDPELFAQITITVPSFQWSPDHERLLYIGPGQNATTTAARAVGRGGDTVVLESAKLPTSPGGCVLAGKEIWLLTASWSPDGQSIALVGLNAPQANYFVATNAGGTPRVFLLPATCYATFVNWSPGALLVPMYGPQCGLTSEENRVAVVDPLTAAALGDIVIGRKSFLTGTAKGDWFVAFKDGETQFVPIRDPANRIHVPSTGFVDWCCS
jgi:hypothetical protein